LFILACSNGSPAGICIPEASDSLAYNRLPMNVTLRTSYRGPSSITNRSVTQLPFSLYSSFRPTRALK